MNCLFDLARVVIRVTINKLYAKISISTTKRDPVDPAKQDGVVYRIPCEYGKVYIGETGRPMQDRIKKHDRDILLARTEISAVLEHTHNTGHKPLWNEVKFITGANHWVKQQGSKYTNQSC